MKALICLKMVHDIDKVLPCDWQVEPGTKTLDISYTPRIINCFDESALELALRVADQSRENGESFELTAVTVDGAKGDKILKQALALKVPEVFRVDCEEDCPLNPELKARILKAAIEKSGSYDIVLFGSQASGMDFGQTGFFAAELMGFPCITDVIGFNRIGNTLKVIRQIENGREILQVRPPVVLIIGNATDAYVRIPSIRETIRASKSEIKTVSLENLGFDRKKLNTTAGPVFEELISIKTKNTCFFLNDSDDKLAGIICDHLRNSRTK